MSDIQVEAEHKSLDRETVRELLSLTEDIDVEPKRNDLCFCMSGKKYKKCCAAIESQSDIRTVELKDFYLVPDTDPKIFQYEMDDEDCNIAADCYELLLAGEFEEDPEAIEYLRMLLRKYPNHPILNTMKALRALIRGEKEVCKETSKSNLEKFPDVTINRLLLKYCEYESYASEFFSRFGGKIEKIPQEAEIVQTYDREQIPLTEFVLTLSLQIYENLFKEKLRKAMSLFEMMTNVLEKMEWEDHAFLERMHLLLSTAKFMRKIKILKANQPEEKANRCGTISTNTQICK